MPRKSKKKKKRQWPVQESRRKKIKDKREATFPRQHPKKGIERIAHGLFCPLRSLIFSFEFSFQFGEKKLLGGPEEKTLEPHHLFSFLST